MAQWNPTVFLTGTNQSNGDCTLWANVDNFDDDWTDSQYWWAQRLVTYYNVMWNNACAIRLLITKCNSLQAQVDALTPGAVDMDAILNAMLSASFGNLQQFIGLVDAYRVALWNAPFNVDFYAALARGFQKWP
jgi:hypothetical protein